MKDIKVQLVYRNYKPLHKIHESLINDPPIGVTFIVPKTLKQAAKLLKFYRRFGDNKYARKLIKVFQSTFFTKSANQSEADILHFINLISEEIPSKPYVVEFEHPLGLANFSSDQDYLQKKVWPFLNNKNCKAIMCMSQAAYNNLQKLYTKNFKQIKAKVVIIYPALNLNQVSNLKATNNYIKNIDKLTLLFVGNDSYRKGLDELLWAFKKTESLYKNKMQLFIVSNDAKPVVDSYKLQNVFIYEPNFSKEEIIKYFFKPANFFIMPTKLDTFGMVFIDSLATSTPIISTTQFAVPEIVDDGKDGLLISYEGILDKKTLPTRQEMQAVDQKNFDQKLAEEIYKTLKYLVDNPSLKNNLSKTMQLKFIKNGKFSIVRRNQQLIKIYKDALK